MPDGEPHRFGSEKFLGGAGVGRLAKNDDSQVDADEAVAGRAHNRDTVTPKCEMPPGSNGAHYELD